MDYKERLKARNRTLTFKERYLDRDQNPVLFLIHSWHFTFKSKIKPFFTYYILGK